MGWTPLSCLIEEYRQQVGIINQRINDIRNQTAENPIGRHEDIETLCSMRLDLMYSIHQMNKYLQEDEKNDY